MNSCQCNFIHCILVFWRSYELTRMYCIRIRIRVNVRAPSVRIMSKAFCDSVLGRFVDGDSTGNGDASNKTMPGSMFVATDPFGTGNDSVLGRFVDGDSTVVHELSEDSSFKRDTTSFNLYRLLLVLFACFFCINTIKYI